ncbi:hypothetical protein PGB90_001853 [Kerria lacca]
MFVVFVSPFVARFIRMEYLFSNFNFSQTICQIDNYIAPIPTEYCKAKIKRELYDYKQFQLPLLIHSNERNLPTNFDARKKWYFCNSISKIRDQGSCGSCWAIAVASTITDRICIHSKGNIKTYISEEDLLACCTECGSGCNGGNPVKAWKYWKKYGIVTGSDYGSNKGCKPYSVAPCIHSDSRNCSDYVPTPTCVLTCKSHYQKNYWNDLYYGYLIYSIVSDETQIMTEVMYNGPVQTHMTLYEDFLRYNSGIYSPSRYTKKISEHSVKIIGWGTDTTTNTDYWIVVNSFNRNWGENGFFRIKRGNTCNIQLNVFSGLPKLDKLI